MPHLSPTTLTTGQQRPILRATAGNVRDNVIFSLALGTGLRLAEIFGLDVGDVFGPGGVARVRVPFGSGSPEERSEQVDR
jgi:integrase